MNEPMISHLEAALGSRELAETAYQAFIDAAPIRFYWPEDDPEMGYTELADLLIDYDLQPGESIDVRFGLEFERREVFA